KWIPFERLELSKDLEAGYQVSHDPGSDGNCFYRAAAFQLGLPWESVKDDVFHYLQLNQYDSPTYARRIKRRQSVTGRRGPTGTPGRPGRNGIDGRQGMDGSMGLPGRDGKDGKDGSPGFPGAPGPPGVNGLQGPRGELGLKGFRGHMGDKGERDQGLPGPKGGRGPTGRNGEDGEPGNSGRDGSRGQKGEAGSVTCYVTENGRRIRKDCYLAAQDASDSTKDDKKHAGVIFERWGRTTCPIGSRSIYSGQAASVYHGKRRTGGSSYKCLPSKPWFFGQRAPGDRLGNTSRPRLDVPGEAGLQASLYYLSCAVCLTKLRSIQIMIPARKECARGWHREYDGFLAVQVNRGENKELICVDREARGIFGTPDYVMALHADCNTFSCPPYTDRERLPCVVCTIKLVHRDEEEEVEKEEEEEEEEEKEEEEEVEEEGEEEEGEKKEEKKGHSL
ncbi:hypothetical protein QZH41_010998, partial [Actinostola sp. cb2023]